MLGFLGRLVMISTDASSAGGFTGSAYWGSGSSHTMGSCPATRRVTRRSNRAAPQLMANSRARARAVPLGGLLRELVGLLRELVGLLLASPRNHNSMWSGGWNSNHHGRVLKMDGASWTAWTIRSMSCTRSYGGSGGM